MVAPEEMDLARLSIVELESAAQSCTGCELYEDATQVVFGRGPESASMMLLGEQPGDREDLEGEPFVGPAGRELDRALEAAGIDRSEVYVTNVVKHFRFEEGERNGFTRSRPASMSRPVGHGSRRSWRGSSPR